MKKIGLYTLLAIGLISLITMLGVKAGYATSQFEFLQQAALVNPGPGFNPGVVTPPPGVNCSNPSACEKQVGGTTDQVEQQQQQQEQDEKSLKTRDELTCDDFKEGGVDPSQRDATDDSKKTIGVGTYGFGLICDQPTSAKVVNGRRQGLIWGLAVGISNWIVGLVGMVIVLMIIVGGVQLVTSAGSPDAVKAAKGRITNAVMSLVVLISMRAILALVSIGAGVNEFFGVAVPNAGETLGSVGGLILAMTNFTLYIAGAVSVMFIIIGALRYAASGGNQTNLQKAKLTISYAVIGLVVSISAVAIVNFIISNIK